MNQPTLAHAKTLARNALHTELRAKAALSTTAETPGDQFAVLLQQWPATALWAMAAVAAEGDPAMWNLNIAPPTP